VGKNWPKRKGDNYYAEVISNDRGVLKRAKARWKWHRERRKRDFVAEWEEGHVRGEKEKNLKRFTGFVGYGTRQSDAIG